MEEEEQSSELISSTNSVEVTTAKDLGDDLVSLDKTIQIENSSLKTSPPEPVETNHPPENLDTKRRKAKEEKPHSKIVVRRLPPTMTKEMFLDQVSPLPEVDYMYYIQGDTNNGFNPFSRAYLNFINQDDLFSFSRTFDNYVFLDAKGQEYPAVVEFAMFQRVPKQRPKKKDPLMGTIESDPTYITFKENLLAEALENSKTGGKAVKQHYFETEISTAEEVNTTPLLEFLKVRRAEKARIREERREEKKRKELERKLKQKTKDKKGEGEDEEVPKESKIQHKPSEKDPEKEVIIEKHKQVGENEKLAKESFDKSKIVNVKQDSNDEKPTVSQDQKFSIFVKSDKDKLQNENESQSKDAEVQKIKEAEQQTMYLRKLLGLLPSDSQLSTSKKEVQAKEKRDNKERDTRNVKKKDDKERIKDTRVREFKSRGGKSYQEERLRLAERREEQKKRDLLNSGDKKIDIDLGETEAGEGTGEQPKISDEKTSRFEKKKYEYRKKYESDDWKDEKKRSRNDRTNLKRDGRDRKDDYRRNQEKKTSDSDLRRKVKTFKNSEFSKVTDDKKKSSNVVHEQVEDKVQEESDKNKIEKNDNELSKNKWKSVDDLVLTSTVERKNSDKVVIENDDIGGSKKRHSSLENLRSEEKCPEEPPPKKVTLLQRERQQPKEMKDRSRKDLSSHKPITETKMYSHKKKDRFHEKQEENKDVNESGIKIRDQEPDQGSSAKSKDVPRPDRRIRNKDRPSIEIYRPGMGKFSKQRLEKEKALGSSTEVDSPSHSPSPTPKSKIIT